MCDPYKEPGIVAFNTDSLSEHVHHRCSWIVEYPQYDGTSLGMNSTKVGVFKEASKVSLKGSLWSYFGLKPVA